MRRVVREHLRKTALPARGASSTCSCGTNSPCFASALPARGASATRCSALLIRSPLPRRYLHGVHRQKLTNCGTPFCGIRRESVDSFSEIKSKDSCADYFPALFCCQGDLHRHDRQPRTGNRPVFGANSTGIFCSFYLRTIEDFFESPCWRVFLALWIGAVSRNGGIEQTEGNLVEAVQNRNSLLEGRNAAIRTQNISLAVSFLHLAYCSTAATAALVYIRPIGDCIDWLSVRLVPSSRQAIRANCISVPKYRSKWPAPYWRLTCQISSFFLSFPFSRISRSLLPDG